MHRADLGDLYARLLAFDLTGGELLVAAGDGPYLTRDIAATSRAADAGGRAEPWPLDKAREKLGDYALTLDQRLSGEKARRSAGWTPSPLRFSRTWRAAL